VKKLFCFAAAFLIMLAVSMPVYAANHFAGTSNASEILEPDKALIAEECKDWLNEKTGLPFGEKNFAYDRAKCVFYRVDLFKEDTLNNQKMQEYIQADDVYALYELPVYFDGGTLLITLVNGYEISEESFANLSDGEKEYFNKIDGRWHAQSHYTKEEHYDYISEVEGLLEENGVNNADVYITAGLSEAVPNFAVVCQEDNEAQFLILGSKAYSDKKLYSFSEMKQLAAEIKNEEEAGGQMIGLASENNKEVRDGVIILVSVAAAAALASVFGMIIGRKRKSA